MADHDRRQARSVKDELYDDASRFSFLQAVRLVEQMELCKDRHCKPAGESVHADEELLFFHHLVRLDNPDSDIESLHCGADGEPPSMITNVLGLAGVLGPLPHTVTEMIIDHLWHGPRHPHDFPAPRQFVDFLDIFNHRLLSLLYRARKKFRPALDPYGPHEGRMSRVLYAFLGLGTPKLQGRVLHTGSDRPLLAYAGLFVDRYRSQAGLERVLADHFEVPVAVKPFIGAWEEIDEDDLTLLGVRNNVLGTTATAFIGRRFWNQAARFEVRLGPLDFSRFVSFLPSAKNAYESLRSLIRFYAHDDLGFDIRLLIEGHQIPQLELWPGRVYLGHTSWLSRRPPEQDDEQVRLVGWR